MSDQTEKQKCDIKDLTVVIMSFISQIAAITISGIIIFHPPDMTNATVATLVGTVLGFLISEAKNFSSYWTGSTRGSSDKDQTIATQQKAIISGTGTGGMQTTATMTPEGMTTLKTEPASKPAEITPDLEQKIKDLVAKYVADGMPPDDAEKKARQEFSKG